MKGSTDGIVRWATFLVLCLLTYNVSLLVVELRKIAEAIGQP